MMRERTCTDATGALDPYKRKWPIKHGWLAGLLITTLVAPVWADSHAPLDEALVEQVKAQVLRELRDSGELAAEIEAGIEAYISRQREERAKAQAEARAEQVRIAAEKASQVRRLTPGRDHVFGPSDAPVTLIEYSDFECPYCKRFHETAKQLVERFEGQVNWVYRHYPLHFHNPGAQKQAEASECAKEQGGNESFWQYTDAIYQRTQSGGQGFALDKLAPLAEELGLDATAFQACLDSGRYAARVQEDVEEGKQAGVTGTPGNILVHNLSGKVSVQSGAKPLQVFEQAVQDLLNAPPGEERAENP